MSTFIIGLIVVVLLGLAVRKMYRDKKSGKHTCGGNCGQCGCCGHHAHHADPEKAEQS